MKYISKHEKRTEVVTRGGPSMSSSDREGVEREAWGWDGVGLRIARNAGARSPASANGILTAEDEYSELVRLSRLNGEDNAAHLAEVGIRHVREGKIESATGRERPVMLVRWPVALCLNR